MTFNPSRTATRPTLALLLVVFLAAPAAALAARAAGEGSAVELPKRVRDRMYYDRGRPDPGKVELGKLLFFDKILSGNLNISCATCHHSLTATGDGLSLPVGEGGRGLGVTRNTGRGRSRIHERVPRNSPPIFNLGARRFRRLFHDGRVEKDKSEPSGFRSPAGPDLPPGLDNVLAVQAMFPVTSNTEMAGQSGENEIGAAAADGNLPLVWQLLAERLRAIPQYVDRFTAVFADVEGAGDVTYRHAANAIAAFETHAWRADGSPFDRYLRGDSSALSRAAKRGMGLFYGEMGCSECHSGSFQTDMRFHAVAMPQIGPGKGDGPDGLDDFGRERVTARRSDRYKFRTPSLRNVALTGPWGHAGAYNDLRLAVRHMLDPTAALESYDTEQAVMPSRPDLDRLDFVVHNDAARRAEIADASELEGGQIDNLERKLDDLIAFLEALTDPASLDLRDDVPRSVPSGLPLAD